MVALVSMEYVVVVAGAYFLFVELIWKADIDIARDQVIDVGHEFISLRELGLGNIDHVKGLEGKVLAGCLAA